MNEWINCNSRITHPGLPVSTTDVWSSSKNSPFVPFISLFVGTTFTKGEEKSLLYSLPTGFPMGLQKIKKYPTAVDFMINNTRVYILETRRNALNYQITKGMVSFVNNDFEVIPLIVLGVKSDTIFSLNKENPDIRNFCLFINKEVYNPEHVLMFKNMKKYYISELEARGVDVVYTNDIKKWLFKPITYVPKFNTVNDMLSHLQTMTEFALDIKRKDEQRESAEQEFQIIDDTQGATDYNTVEF